MPPINRRPTQSPRRPGYVQQPGAPPATPADIANAIKTNFPRAIGNPSTGASIFIANTGPGSAASASSPSVTGAFPISVSANEVSIAVASNTSVGAVQGDGATTTVNSAGVLSSNGITALTGDGTATGPGSVAFTLAASGVSAGSYGSASSVATFTANAKGLITLAASTAIAIAQSQVTGLVATLAALVPTTRNINTSPPLGGGGALSADLTLTLKRTIAWSGPSTLSTGADTLEVTLPSDFSSRALTRVVVRVGTASSSGSFSVKLELATGTGAFTVVQTSDAFTLTSGTYESIVTSFTNGLTGSAGNKVRFNITALGTSTANLTIETEWL